MQKAILTPITSRRIRTYVSRLVQQFNPEKVILFGSRARGDHHAESDIDLLVIMRYRGSPIDVQVRMVMAMNPVGRIDLILMRPREFLRRYREFDAIARHATDEGRVLYEQDGRRLAGSRRG